MGQALQQAAAWLTYRLLRVYWWVRRPVVLGVRVLVVHESRVLVVKHSYRKGWFLPGGRPERGESLAATARREANEETGMVIEGPELFGIYSSLDGPESDHVVVFVATGPFRSTVRDRGHDSEIDGVQWLNIGGLPKDTAAQTRQIVRDWRRGTGSTYRIVDES
jgi:8-oxo-dGTP pyrophosphatase MutT (NUDIX family)